MKLIGVILIILGLFVATRLQFNKIMKSGTTPEAGQHPLVEKLVPALPGAGPAQPARATSRRIWTVGAAGVFCLATGTGLILIHRKQGYP